MVEKAKQLSATTSRTSLTPNNFANSNFSSNSNFQLKLDTKTQNIDPDKRLTKRLKIEADKRVWLTNCKLAILILHSFLATVWPHVPY